MTPFEELQAELTQLKEEDQRLRSQMAGLFVANKLIARLS